MLFHYKDKEIISSPKFSYKNRKLDFPLFVAFGHKTKCIAEREEKEVLDQGTEY